MTDALRVTPARVTPPRPTAGWHRHVIGGLRLRSSQRLPGVPDAADGPWDVAVRIAAFPAWARAVAGADPRYVAAEHDEHGRPLLTVWASPAAEACLLQYADGTEFLLDGDGANLWVRWPSPWTLDDAATYLVGPVLAFVLRRRGATCLHASAVALGERAVALVGPSGAGKSTLAAGFAQRGYEPVSDDVTTLARAGGRFAVQPGPARVRLWPESVAALFGAPDALPRLTPTWDKRVLDVPCRQQPGDAALPLAAIYLLDASGAGEPRLETVPAADALLALVANTSVNYLLDGHQRAEEFACLGDLVRAVPVRRLARGEDLAAIGRLVDLIVDDVERRA